MKKICLLLVMILTVCASAFAADDVPAVSPDYQAVLGGGHAVVELTDNAVMAAVANLKVYRDMNAVVLPKGIENYRVVRAGNEQAFLIIPHFVKTRLSVLNAATRKKEGELKGDLEGRSIVLFCNKGDAVVNLLVRGGYGIQLVNFVPEAEEQQENGRPGAMIIPERKQRYLKDVTGLVRHDGDIINFE